MTTTEIRASVRGTIIKVPDNHPGLLIVDGAQQPFTLEGIWRSAVAPSVNQVVEVETNSLGAIVSIATVNPQQLTKERLNQLGESAQDHGKQAAELARKGVGLLAARMGKMALGALAVVWIGWFFLPAVKFSSLLGSTSFTLWDVLGSDVGIQGFRGESHGLFSLVGVAAIVSPLVAPFLGHPRARFLYGAPLVFLVLTFLKVRWGISSAMGQMGSAKGQVPPQMQQYVADMVKTSVRAMMDSISIGYGAYVLVAASIALAVQALKTTPVVSE